MAASLQVTFYTSRWHPEGFFSSSEDLRQRDPPSPSVFTLLEDSLSQVITNVESISIFKSFLVGPNEANVSHLPFADDILLLTSREQRNVLILKSLICCFELVSRINFTWAKTHL